MARVRYFFFLYYWVSFVTYHGRIMGLEANNLEASYISITLHSNAIVYRWKVVKRYATNDAQSDISCCPNIHRITLLSRCVVVDSMQYIVYTT